MRLACPGNSKRTKQAGGTLLKTLQRILCFALLAAMMLSMAVVSHADEPSFDYSLKVTSATGKELSSLTGLGKGDRIYLSVELKRTDTAERYGVYGLEFKVLSRGLQYNNDGVDFQGGSDVTLNKYIAGDLVGITYYDMTREGVMIDNPITACSWSYTVTDPAAANLELATAIIFPNGKTESSHPVGNASLTLDPNGGSIVGKDVSGEYTSGTAVTLPDASRSGYRFDGWSDGVKTYPAGGSYTVTGIVTLTAQWTELVRLTLNANDGSIVGTDVTGDYAVGTTVKLPDAARTDYIFGGWSDGVTTYAAGSNYTVTKAATLTAQWTAKPVGKVHVTLILNGGTLVGQNIAGDHVIGQTVTVPGATRSGYTFDGWYDSVSKTTYKTGDMLRLLVDTTLTAQWTKDEDAPPVVIVDPGTPTVRPTVEKGSHFNYIIGYPNGDFGPYDNITRAEVAMIIYRILSPETRVRFETSANRFPDVVDGAWYNVAVSTLARAGIVEGMPDGMFHPTNTISRAELATIISRFTNISGGKATFPDSVNHWASSYIATAADNGWVLGYPDGTFKPNNPISRAETVTMINRLLERNPETEDDLLPNMIMFNDVTDPNVWYYVQVQEAANNHEYQRKADNVHEKWTARLTDIVW
jgi:uncharacterized repeat protein (TIGR02543 family)